jgi:FAD binding domain
MPLWNKLERLAAANVDESFGSLSMQVLLPSNELPAWAQALSSRAHNACGTTDGDHHAHQDTSNLPTTVVDAIVVAHSAEAVAYVLRLVYESNRLEEARQCSGNEAAAAADATRTKQLWQVNVRCGGHAWYPRDTWLRQGHSANHKNDTKILLLDVGDLNDIAFKGGTLSVGPGATGVAILEECYKRNVFLPVGHVDSVCIGGFVLGGGCGLGYSKYGWTCTLLSAVDAVLANGDLVSVNMQPTQDHDENVNSETREQHEAIRALVRGSYTGFPGVIVRYHFDALPPYPRGVLTGSATVDLEQWQSAVTLALDMQWHCDDKDVALCVESSVVLMHAPPHLAHVAPSGKVAMIHLVVWADTMSEGLALWRHYTAPLARSSLAWLEPLAEPPQSVTPHDLVRTAAAWYPPRSRYVTHAHVGRAPHLYDMEHDDILALLQPLAAMWLESPLPPPSHSFVTPVHQAFGCRHGKAVSMATGCTLALSVQTFGIYSDASHDADHAARLATAHSALAAHDAFRTDLVTGSTVLSGIAACFASPHDYDQVLRQRALLDPTAVFVGFANAAAGSRD